MALTVATENVDELRVRSACEFFPSKRIPDDSVVAQNDDELGTEPRTEHGAVFLSELAEVQMNVALDERQISAYRYAPRSGRQTAQASQPQCRCENDDEHEEAVQYFDLGASHRLPHPLCRVFH